MSRIELSRRAAIAGGCAVIGSAAVAADGNSGGRVAPALDSSQRKFAHDKLRGLMNLFLPTFLPDSRKLDEEAVRHDVRNAIAHGFSASMPMINWTLPGTPEWADLYRIVVDEAGSDIAIHGVVAGRDSSSDIRVLSALENAGVQLVLLASSYPADSSADELHSAMASRIESTRLPVMLYAATGRRAFPALGPAGQPLEVYDRIADIPNVVAVKISQSVNLTSTMQLCQCVGDRLSMGPVNLDYLPLLARHFRISWSGQWNAEAVQTPTRQIGNALLAASHDGDWAKLDRLAREIEPVLSHFFAVQEPVIRRGAHPWQHNRYYQWLAGGNGGLLPRDPHAPEGAIPTLDAKARAAMRKAFATSGLEVTDGPEEQFIVGRAAWARGVRASDLTDLPYYSKE